MPYFGEPSSSFFYRRWAAAEPSSAVLLLHGWGEQSGYFHRFAAELTRDGSDVWAPDHVGHGLSGRHDGVFDSVDQLVDNAEALLGRITAEQPRLPVIVVGHSLGGLTALGLAARNPGVLRGLVVSGAPVAGPPDHVDDDAVWSDDESYVDNVTHDPLAVDSEEGEAALWRAVSAFLPGLEATTAAIDPATLVIYGEHDVLTDMKRAAQWTSTLPNGRLVVFPGGYHDILNDSNHRAVAAEITAFVRELRN
ncbi:alpha/beta hydrolase [Streptomyces phaeolivaceus]|uniref:alpha/beta hydrolase n=1 Tax=Streptomyces phaeolivaceus TaxID=2653200 RepID=UPI00186A4844|nr:alpha/beta fold hydrolase [Streptomyces phaeolivaceus]